jgi:HTH-type transcriptional regulator, sugar sensing transcriptional regulator
MSNVVELTRLGLSIQEANIYIALLELGPSKVNDILKKTHINRTHIYDRLEKLIGKGMVSSMIKNGKKVFYAAKPNALSIFVQKKEIELEKQKSSLKLLVKNLEKIPLNEVSESIEVYEGKDGLKSVLEDILRSKSDVLTYGSEGNFTKVLQYYFKHYLKNLEKNKIRMKVIFNADDDKNVLKLKFADVRYIPKEYSTPTEITIYADKVAIFLFADTPKAILIKSKTASVSYHKYFDFMWRTAKSSSNI